MFLHFCKSNFSPVSISFLVIAMFSFTSPARAQDPTFDMHSSSTLRGQNGQIMGTIYLNHSAQPASQVLVNIRSMTSGRTHEVVTDLGGHFELREIPPGSYEVSASGRGSGLASATVDVSTFPAEVTLYLNSSKAPPRGENPYVVSTHELQIPQKAQNEYSRGLDLMAKKDFAGSLAHFSKAAADYPDYYEAIYHVGLLELRAQSSRQGRRKFPKGD